MPLTIQTHNLSSNMIKLAELAMGGHHCDRKRGTHSIKNMPVLRSKRVLGSTQNKISPSQGSFALTVFASQSSVNQIVPSLDLDAGIEELENASTYVFRTDIGGQVKVVVGRKNMKYAVYIEASSLSQFSSEHNLVLSWGILKFHSSHLKVLDSQSLAPNEGQFTSGTIPDSIQTPFIQKSLGTYVLELEFDSNQAPFYLSFLLHSSFDANSSDSGIRSHRQTKFCVPVGIGRGNPAPLGISFPNDGSVNFSLFSRNAESVVLCLYHEKTAEPSLEIDLDPYVNRTGDIWHVSMESGEQYVSYGFRCKGDILWDRGGRFHMRHVLLDPYAKVLGAFFPDQGKSVSLVKCLGVLCKEPTFDWEGDIHPRLPLEKLVVYRLNVRRFTGDKSSQLPNDVAGTFLGIIKKLSHFKSLGVNAILLEPIFPFDEQKGPYFPYHFFSPMTIYGSRHDGMSAINSMKEMTKVLHSNGIEVLLEVVFNHTAEGGDNSCQTISFRGIDNSSYYIVDSDVGSGAGNALNCNNPIVQQLIVDSLRHWVTNFHIDGFCFVGASYLTRGVGGECLSRPPLVEAIAFDPVLSKTKIIADCWSPLEMSFKEINFPHWKRWAEMNTRFCYDVRNFLRGEGGLSSLATRLCGSGDVFSDSRGPAFSFNFTASNFGLSLVDLVSFSSSDLSSQLSWNCGEEGPTNNNAVLEKRVKQIRNFLFILYISLGVPVLNMGDECGESTGGLPCYNNRRYFDWNSLRTGFGVQTTKFIAFLGSLRMRRSDLLQKRNFLKEENIDWHGNDQSQPNWEDPSCKFLAMTLKTEKDEEQPSSDRGDLFIAFNASEFSESVILPQLSEGIEWLRLVDTALPFPGFFLMDGDPVQQTEGLATYEIQPHSCALFEAQRSSS
ncbi:debranching enzyme 1 [Tasmannia lanceolata]|uniref:debranching enzyme 1 n=1 Tax=Tasmannia lanceolata TaxID=3420 RepID=UPI0040639647